MTNGTQATTRLDLIRRAISQPKFQTVIFLGLFLGFGLFCYWPGLTGIFQLDDTFNLRAIQKLENADDSTRMLDFVLNGVSGPGGRPISMASFLLNDNAWPGDPWSYKYTNLCIHLINGLLVFLLCLRLLPLLPHKIAEQREKHVISAALCSLLWTLHPFQISSVLYIIQRMTELSAMFMLLGMVTYVKARQRIDSQPLAGYAWASVAIVVCGLLAVFSKENGVLLVFYVFVLENVLLKKSQPVAHRYWKIWQNLFVVLPLLVIVAYLGFKVQGFEASFKAHAFTVVERLLSEARILVEYLYHIFIPKLGGNGLYHDDYVISRGLFDPPTTFFALLFLGLLFFAAVKLRHKAPLVSFSIFWFFASHVLESTVVPLELYFEHRNYLAIFGFALLPACYIHQVPLKARRISQFALLCLGLVFIVFTRFDAQIWGDSKRLAFIWVDEHPMSVRAAQDASAAALAYGETELARKYISQAVKRHPDNSGLLLQEMHYACLDGKFDPATIPNIAKSIRYGLPYQNGGSAAIRITENLVTLMPIKECPNFKREHLITIINAFLENPKYSWRNMRHGLHYLLGELYVGERDLNAAMSHFDAANAEIHRAEVPVEQILILTSAGLYEDALRYVELAREYDNHPANPFLRHAFKKTIDKYENAIKKLMKRTPTS